MSAEDPGYLLRAYGVYSVVDNFFERLEADKEE